MWVDYLGEGGGLESVESMSYQRRVSTLYANGAILVISNYNNIGVWGEVCDSSGVDGARYHLQILSRRDNIFLAPDPL